MARGQNASTGRAARSEGLPNSDKPMKQSEAEAYLIKNANRGYPADRNDLLAQYGEEAYEMGANGMRAPAYGKWLEQQVGRKVRSQTTEQERKKKLDTPEGKKIETGYLFAKELHKEARDATNKARDTLEAKFKEVHGQYLDIYMDEQSERRGLSMSEIDDRIKSIIPEEHAKLEKAHATEQALYDRYTAREKARNEFLNGSDAGSQPTGRAARSEFNRNSLNISTERQKKLEEVASRTDISGAAKAIISGQILRGERDGK
jgi:hypothetical protein